MHGRDLRINWNKVALDRKNPKNVQQIVTKGNLIKLLNIIFPTRFFGKITEFRFALDGTDDLIFEETCKNKVNVNNIIAKLRMRSNLFKQHVKKSKIVLIFELI